MSTRPVARAVNLLWRSGAGMSEETWRGRTPTFFAPAPRLTYTDARETRKLSKDPAGPASGRPPFLRHVCSHDTSDWSWISVSCRPRSVISFGNANAQGKGLVGISLICQELSSFSAVAATG